MKVDDVTSSATEADEGGGTLPSNDGVGGRVCGRGKGVSGTLED